MDLWELYFGFVDAKLSVVVLLSPCKYRTNVRVLVVLTSPESVVFINQHMKNHEMGHRC